jgi:hypothetical protein
VPDHDLDHLEYEDEHKTIADIGWWEEHDRTPRRFIFTLHGRRDHVRYVLIKTGADWLLGRTNDQTAGPVRVSRRGRVACWDRVIPGRAERGCQD